MAQASFLPPPPNCHLRRYQHTLSHPLVYRTHLTYVGLLMSVVSLLHWTFKASQTKVDDPIHYSIITSQVVHPTLYNTNGGAQMRYRCSPMEGSYTEYHI